ncbi:MAG: hypothetical protein FVQ79_03700 [Planctomycetes bacterium]|nr:hypothetical protein [Planctomycetota bacterium]
MSLISGFGENFFAAPSHGKSVLDGTMLSQQAIIERCVAGLRERLGPQAHGLESEALLQRLKDHRTFVFGKSRYHYQKNFAEKNTNLVFKFFFENEEVSEDDLKILLETADILIYPIEAFGDSFSYCVYSVYDMLAHFSNHVLGENYDPSKGDLSPYSERLFHPCYVACMGSILLHHYPVCSLDGDRRLKDLVRDLYFSYLRDHRQQLASVLEIDVNDVESLLEHCFHGERGRDFVINCWHCASLFHDIGYYLSLVWEVTGYNMRRPENGGVCEIGNFYSFTRQDCFDCGLDDVKDIPKNFHRIGILHDLFDFISEDHIESTIENMFPNVINEVRLEKRKNFYGVNRRWHAPWAAYELVRRFDSQRKISNSMDNLKDCLVLLTAASAAYGHHYSIDGKDTLSESTTAEQEETNPLLFTREPIPFLLKLLDSCQNFSRFKFEKIETENISSKTSSKSKPIAFLLKLLDSCQNFLRSKFEKIETENISSKTSSKSKPIAFFLKKDELFVRLRREKGYRQVKGTQLFITFDGTMNDPKRSMSLQRWVEKSNEEQSENYDESLGGFFVTIENARQKKKEM